MATPANLVVALTSRFHLLLTEYVGVEVAVEGVVFRETDSLDFTGFYDWLRSTDGRLLGVRYSPFDGFATGLLESVAAKPLCGCRCAAVRNTVLLGRSCVRSQEIRRPRLRRQPHLVISIARV